MSGYVDTYSFTATDFPSDILYTDDLPSLIIVTLRLSGLSRATKISKSLPKAFIFLRFMKSQSFGSRGDKVKLLNQVGRIPNIPSVMIRP